MRNFIITVNGKNYEVGVEEVGAGAQAPAVVSAPKEAPKAAAAAAAAPKAAPAVGEKVVSPFPGLIKNLLVAEGAAVKKDQPVFLRCQRSKRRIRYRSFRHRLKTDKERFHDAKFTR